jgi:hypothetical protein
MCRTAHGMAINVLDMRNETKAGAQSPEHPDRRAPLPSPFLPRRVIAASS